MRTQSKTADVEVMVIGGGPAGAAAACHLAKMGRATAVIEQHAIPQHKVCGEFLSHEALRYLDELEIDVKSLGAVPIHGVRLSTREHVAAVELPFPACSLTRCKLDEELLRRATSRSVHVLRGQRVESLEDSDGVWSATRTDGTRIQARAAFLATGKHDLRGFRRPERTGLDFVAFKMYWHLSPLQLSLLQGWVEVFLFPGGYAGLQLTEDSKANLCLLVHRKALHRCHNDWPSLLAWISQYSAPLAERLAGATPLLSRPLALSSIPYGLLRERSDTGLWLLGDQTAVTPSFSGEGISIALHSAKVASALYTSGRTPDSLAALLSQQLRHPIAVAGALANLMMAAPALAVLARIWPRSLRYIAEQTRIPQFAFDTSGRNLH